MPRLGIAASVIGTLLRSSQTTEAFRRSFFLQNLHYKWHDMALLNRLSEGRAVSLSDGAL